MKEVLDLAEKGNTARKWKRVLSSHGVERRRQLLNPLPKEAMRNGLQMSKLIVMYSEHNFYRFLIIPFVMLTIVFLSCFDNVRELF